MISIIVYGAIPVLMVNIHKLNYGYALLLFFLLSLVFSTFFIKENIFFEYIKLSFFYALFQGLILGIEFNLFIYFNDSEFRLNFADLNPNFLIMNLLLIFIFNVLPIFLGSIIGIIPKGTMERLVKNPKQ